MGMPGFTANMSLYGSMGHYRTTGTVVQAEGRVLPALSGISLGALLSGAFVKGGRECDVDATGRRLADFGPVREVDTRQARSASADGGVIAWMSAAYRQGGLGLAVKAQSDPESRAVTGPVSWVIPMSVPGQVEFVASSTQCQMCQVTCFGASTGCLIGVGAGCAALFAVPFVGGALYAACDIAGSIACTAADVSCTNNCFNIGSACCPVDCGVSCCNSGEVCLDSAHGLCCPRGTQPCRGPQESCYDPNTETCMQSGQGCRYGGECGSVCCDEFSTCVDPNAGTCCGGLVGLPCGSLCCNAITEVCTSAGCCPTDQACGGVCCPSGFLCSAGGQCVPAPTCPPDQYLCVSLDKTTQNCCPAYMSCNPDGSCYYFKG